MYIYLLSIAVYITVCHSLSLQANGLSIRHPSFELVLSFIRNSGVSVDRVHSLLQQRAALARRVVSGYSTASNVTAIMTSSGASDVSYMYTVHVYQILYYTCNFSNFGLLKMENYSTETSFMSIISR